jgi:hypothetical protein
MAKRTWEFEVEGIPHRLELEHGFISGKRKISLDGLVIEQTSKLSHLLMDIGSVHRFEIGESTGVLVISTNGLSFSYDFVLDREPIEPLEDVKPSKLQEVGVLLTFMVGMLVFAFVFCYLTPVLLFVDESERSLRDISITFVSLMSGVVVTFIILGSLATMLRSRRFRLSMRWILLAVSIWLYLATMVFWATDYQGSVGVIAAVRQGAPFWLLVVPILSAISMLVLALNPPGVSGILFFFGLAFTTIPLMFFEYENASQISDFELALGGDSAFFIGFFYWMILAAYAIRSQHVPLNAWFARLYYLGSYKHYLSLYEFARECRTGIAGPIPETNNEVILQGTWRSKNFGIHSGKDGLTISVVSEVLYWPFILHNSFLKLPSSTTEGAVHGTCKNARGKEIPFYYWSWNKEFPMESTVRRLEGQINTAQPLLKGDVEIRAGGPAVTYQRNKLHRMPLMIDDIKQILDWLELFSNQIDELGMWDELPEEEEGEREIEN